MGVEAFRRQLALAIVDGYGLEVEVMQQLSEWSTASVIAEIRNGLGDLYAGVASLLGAPVGDRVVWNAARVLGKEDAVKPEEAKPLTEAQKKEMAARFKSMAGF